MVGKKCITCSKCGVNSMEDSTLTFHRFPSVSTRDVPLKAKVWAKYCFPNEDWTSNESLDKLYKQNKFLCGKHFDESSFTNSARNRLNKFAIPFEAKNILAQERAELLKIRALDTQETQIVPEVRASTSQCTSTSMEDLIDEHNLKNPNNAKVVPEVQASTSQCTSTSMEDLIDEHNPQNPNIAKVVPEVQASASQYTSTSMEDLIDECNPQTPNMTKKSHKGIIEELGVKSVASLTPKKKKMYKRCRKNLSEILRLRRKFREMKKCKRNILEALHSNEAVQEVLANQLSSPFYLLLQSQLRNTSKKLEGRRWTLEDKVLALSIYKKSSSCYRLLRRLFCLPSVSSLKALLNKIPLMCGINTHIIESIKEIAKSRSVEDNLCILAFDEMSTRKNLVYNGRMDQIDGYQDHAGQGRTSEVASKALTFMAIGIRKKWKQPIAFYFSGANVTADRLTALIKEVLGACFDAGLEVVATVSDCDGVNLRALNLLGSTTNQPYFEYEGHEIVTILDPPHLLKCFRNNFMKHDIEFVQDSQIEGKDNKGIAKWAHIEQLYNVEKTNPNFVFAPALTPQHLQPNGKQKMKVRLAAQVLSHSVAAGLYAKVAQNELPQDAVATATLVGDMDKLFDAVNGDSADRKRGKPLLTNMSSTSLHLQLFTKMKKFFKQMKFLGAKSKPPSQEGWLRTINAIERLYKNVKHYNVKTLSPRRLNQDPLENCFGCIRNNCGSNPNPTSVQFVAALKTGIMTNLINNERNRNCADDQNDILSNLKIFLSKDSVTPISDEMEGLQEDDKTINCSDDKQIIEGPEEIEDILQYSGEMQACAYVSGFIAKNMDLSCENCKKIFVADPNTEVCHLFTSFKEYDENKLNLKYIQPSFGNFIENAATEINNYLKQNSHEKKIKHDLLNIVNTKIKNNCLNGCEIHKEINLKKSMDTTIFICIKRFCTLKNRQFSEEYTKQSLLRKIKILKNV